MSCSNITQGFILDCNSGNAGIEKVFIANGPVEGITAAAGVVSDIVVGGSSLTPSDFFTFELPRQTGNFTESYNVDQTTGTSVFNQDLSLVFNRLSAEKRNQLLLMAQATSMVIVFKTNENLYFTVGLERGAFMTSGSTLTGTSYTDRAGYEITLSGIEASPAYEIVSSIVEA